MEARCPKTLGSCPPKGTGYKGAISLDVCISEGWLPCQRVNVRELRDPRKLTYLLHSFTYIWQGQRKVLKEKGEDGGDVSPLQQGEFSCCCCCFFFLNYYVQLANIQYIVLVNLHRSSPWPGRGYCRPDVVHVIQNPSAGGGMGDELRGRHPQAILSLETTQ